MRLTPMLQVRDVEATSRWYQAALGLRSGHGGPEYEMLFSGDAFFLQLHRLDAHEHAVLAPRPGERPGVGTSLWFEVADRPAFDALVAQIEATGAVLAEAVHWNPLAHHYEATTHDPDGYVVVVCTAFDPNGP